MNSTTDLPLDRIVDALRTFDARKPLPMRELQAAIARREEIIPVLLGALEKAAEEPVDALSEADLAFYALHLLAQFREIRALPVAVRVLSRPEPDVDALFGDLVTEALDRILASLCGDDVRPLQTLIENRDASEWVRGAAIRALAIAYANGRLSRQTIVSYFRRLLDGGVGSRDNGVPGSLICVCEAIHLHELHEWIRSCFKRCAIDPMMATLQHVERTFARSEGEVLLEFRERYPLVVDAVKELNRWRRAEAGAKGGALEAFARMEKALRAEQLKSSTARLPLQAASKAGRNDLCPCGSGKKYKKCCGKA